MSATEWIANELNKRYTLDDAAGRDVARDPDPGQGPELRHACAAWVLCGPPVT